MGRRDPLLLLGLLGLLTLLAEAALDPPLEAAPEKSEPKRRSSVLICCLIETASCNFAKDKSIRPR